MTIAKHIRNSFISLVTTVGITALYRKKIQQKGALVRVIVFHDVLDSDWFTRSITHLAQTYHIVSPRAFFAGEFDMEKINILITFDDGYASWVHTCVPVLAKRGIHAMFFVNSGLLDVLNDAGAQAHYVRTNLLLSPHKTLSWEGLQKIHIEGHTIGGHTTTHARLAELQENMQMTEITGDRKRIMEKLGYEPTAFAYPFGSVTDYTVTTKQLVKEAGYAHAFTTEYGFANTTHGDSYAIPRLCIEDGLSTSQIDKWIIGGYDVFSYIKGICVR